MNHTQAMKKKKKQLHQQLIYSCTTSLFKTLFKSLKVLALSKHYFHLYDF